MRMTRTRERTAHIANIRCRATIGDYARYVAFVAPALGAFAKALASARARLGREGIVVACACAICALPFWRAFCGRPVFGFYGAVLRRYRGKMRAEAFEGEGEGSSAEAIGKAMRASSRALSEEVRAFVDARWREVNALGEGEVEGEGETSEKMRASGWETIALHDGTLETANRLAARCFPQAIRAMSVVGGFNGKIWVLWPGAEGSAGATGRVTTGLADGYWRVHVVLARDAGLHGKAAGLKAGDETRELDVGSVHIVNDFHPRAFWNVSRNSGVVLLSFDVVRPEHTFCRAAFVDARARLTRAFGAARSADDEANVMAYLWRTFSLTLWCNLS